MGIRVTCRGCLVTAQHQWGKVLLLVLMLLGIGWASPAWGQEPQRDQQSCSTLIAAAETEYLNGSFQETIQLVSECLNQQGVTADEAVQAYRLLSLAYLKQNELEAAREAIVDLLGVRPTYEPDPVEDPPTYVSLVSIVRQEVHPEGLPAEQPDEERRTPFFKRTSTWLALGGTLLAGGAVAFFTVGGGGNGGGGGGQTMTLPLPPGTP